jgi:hypothetical protein
MQKVGVTVPPVGLGDKAATREHGEWHVGIIPQKEPYLLLPIQSTRHGEMEVRINSVPRSDEDVHTTQNCRFHSRALLELGVKEVVPQIEVGLHPHVGLTQGHEGQYVQDP